MTTNKDVMAEWEALRQREKLELDTRMLDTSREHAVADYLERMNKSRENVVYLYLSYYRQAMRSVVTAGDVHELQFRADRLAEAKSKHIATYGEELTLNFRKV